MLERSEKSIEQSIEQSVGQNTGQSIEQRLEKLDDTFTKSERRIAVYLRENPDAVQYMSITTLSEKCGVSEATISRFCRKLGLEGYNDLKITLAQRNASPAFSGKVHLGPSLTSGEIIEMCAAVDADALTATARALDPDAIDRAVGLIERAQNVYCFGQGGSSLLAQDICSRFMTFHSGFRAGGDSHTQLLQAANMTENDVILFVSYSGATRDMVDTLETARKRKVRVILITHCGDSTGAGYADAVLLCGQKESLLESGSIPVKISILFAADVLVLRYLSRHREESEEAQKRAVMALNTKYI